MYFLIPMRRVYTVLFMLFSFRSVIADEVILQHDGLTLNAELTLAAGRTIPDGVIVMLHGTLGHNGMDCRISDLTLDDGQPLVASKNYRVAGWATVASESPGPPVWDVVAEYLRSKKTIKVDKLNTPKLLNVSDNAGLADYSDLME